jgi:nicotinamide-nucleotide amidase
MKSKKKGTAEIISIGDELLIGQVVNTNASWMAEQLSLAGIKLNRITAIADEVDALHQALDEAIERSEFILLTGGLGPTADDLTKPALCSYFNTEMVFNEKAFAQIEKLFGARQMPVTERNREQAFLPANCQPIENANGTAPGMWFKHRMSYIAAMPGVPFEMKTMFAQQLIPMMLAISEKRVFLHKTLMTTGLGESWLADRIKVWEENLPKNLHLAYLPQPGIVRLRLSGLGTDAKLLAKVMQSQVDSLTTLIPDLIYGFDDQSMEEVVADLLKKQQKTIATAESCTGGYIAHLLTGIPGSSAYFKGAIVAYDNSIKSGLLDVDQQLLQTHGAVSKEVVEAMAEGARAKFGVNLALTTSGIAGPDGGTSDKPVGTVWIALSSEKGTTSERFQFGEHRGRNIRRSGLSALNMVRLWLLQNA